MIVVHSLRRNVKIYLHNVISKKKYIYFILPLVSHPTRSHRKHPKFKSFKLLFMAALRVSTPEQNVKEHRICFNRLANVFQSLVQFGNDQRHDVICKTSMTAEIQSNLASSTNSFKLRQSISLKLDYYF